MFHYDFDEIVDRAKTSSMKYGMIPEVYPGAPEDAIPLWIADMDFACPPFALQAIKDRCDRKILGYSKLLEDDYYEAFIGFESRIHGLSVKKEWVVFSSGVIPAVRYLITVLSRPGEGVVVNTPGYNPFKESILATERVLVTSPLQVDGEGRAHLDFADMERKFADSRNRIYIFCSPQNPTGRVWEEKEIREVHDLCRKYGVHIISDEIHSDLIRCGITHLPMIGLFPDDNDIYTCTAPSKTFNMAGMHFSNILIKDKTLRDKWYCNQPCGHPSPLSIEAAKACFLFGDEWLHELREYLDGNVRILQFFLKEKLPKAVFFPPEGTYLAWVDLSPYGFSDEQIMERCVRRGVLIEGSSSFIGDAQGHVRINLAAPKAVLSKGLERMAAAIADES
jgi:cysteine-S-conjugate beta-lyase